MAKFALYLILVSGLFYLFHIPHAQIPPLGKLLNPFAGLLQNGTTNVLMDNQPIPGLKEDVVVHWDGRRVPHIFADNERDLYFAQGFLTARDRLWQMEFQIFVAAGRLSEIVGPSALEFDHYRRRIGMVYAAENALAAAMEKSETKLMMTAYSEGVNAWIDQLDDKRLPVEYKILDYKPESWTPLKSMLLMKMFAWQLTFRSTERLMNRTKAALGGDVMEKLFPAIPGISEPVIPQSVQFNFTPKKRSRPNAEYVPSLLRQQAGGWDFILEIPQNIGSNNWAVSGSKTENGYPILSSDPHLGLNLPSIWYETQLNAPGLNVYGVTSPGAPGIVIGFNEDIAWGVSNAGSDVVDWFEIQFKDAKNNEYWYDGSWRPVNFRIEEMRVRGGVTIVDSVRYTHHGPVVYLAGEDPYDRQVPPGSALRWTAHDPSNEGLGLYKLNRADNYEGFVDALESFDGPAQNFVYADRYGEIAMHHHGKFPVRWQNQGKYILDGSDPRSDWVDYIPKDQLPLVKNPRQGFVSSANQVPAHNYPYYLGWNYASPERAIRINQRLRNMNKITAAEMIELQGDVESFHAKTLVPILLKAINGDSLNVLETQAYEAVRDWEYEYRADLIGPWVFEVWWSYLRRGIWGDDLPSLRWPSRIWTTNLIMTDPQSPFYDDVTTTGRETFQDIALQSFRQAVAQISEDSGAFGPSWNLGESRGTHLLHLARIPGLGRFNLKTHGSSTTINATTHTHGPSWRMVVELGPEVRGWGIYPGGQSGNPGSVNYGEMVDDWVAGKMYRLVFMRSQHDQNAALAGKTILEASP